MISRYAIPKLRRVIICYCVTQYQTGDTGLVDPGTGAKSNVWGIVSDASSDGGPASGGYSHKDSIVRKPIRVVTNADEMLYGDADAANVKDDDVLMMDRHGLREPPDRLQETTEIAETAGKHDLHLVA